LKAGGAEISLAASNPLSTQDDVRRGPHGVRGGCPRAAGVDRDTYYRHINQVLDIAPDIVLDDGCDLVNILHTERVELLDGVTGGCEETTTGSSGCARWPRRRAAVPGRGRQRHADQADVRQPVRHRPVEPSTAIMRATNALLAGKDRGGGRVRVLRAGVAERPRGSARG